MVVKKIDGKWVNTNSINVSKSFDNVTKKEQTDNIKNANLNTKWGDRTLQSLMGDSSIFIDWNNKDLYDAKEVRYKTDKEKILEKYKDNPNVKINGNRIEKWDKYSYKKDGGKRKEREDVEYSWEFDGNGNLTRETDYKLVKYDNGLKRYKVQEEKIYENNQLVKEYSYKYDNGKRTERVKTDYKTGKVKTKSYNQSQTTNTISKSFDNVTKKEQTDNI